MNALLSPADIERIAKTNGRSMRQVCEGAGIAFSTFSRWRAGQTRPTLDVYERIARAAGPEIVAAAQVGAA